MEYKHLLGRKFQFGVTDCYGLLRDFYRDNFNIELPNYARPTNFWQHGLNLYGDRIMKQGFRPLDCHPTDYQYGDVILMSIKSAVPNHVGILVESNLMLHHMRDSLSATTPYKGIWRNTTIGVYRHKDVVLPSTVQTWNAIDLISPARRRAINDAIREAQEEIRSP